MTFFKNIFFFMVVALLHNGAMASSDIIEADSSLPAPEEKKNGYSYGLSISDKQAQKLVQKFGPFVYLHPKDKYFPSSVKDYVEKSYIQCYEDKNAKKLVFTEKYEDPTLDTLATLADEKDGGRNCRIILKNKKKDLVGSLPLRDGRITAPAYVNIYEANSNYYILQFAFFYPYNGPTIGLGKLIPIGAHEGDWEHLDVHVVRSKGGKNFEVKRVHYAAHQQFRGGMRELGQFEFFQKHPVAYSALHGHGSLPKPTKLDGNLDSAKKSNHVWDCGKYHEIVAINGKPLEGEGWVRFKGSYGETQQGKNNFFCNSPGGPMWQGWWRMKGRTTYNLIDDLGDDNSSLPIKNKKGKGTRSFIYECPSRLAEDFCVEFVQENDNDYDGDIPPFKIIQGNVLRKVVGTKTLYKSQDAFKLTKSGKTYKYCFKRPKKTHLEKIKFIWATEEVPPIDLGLKVTGFEYVGEDKEIN